MASELQVTYASGRNIYFLIRNRIGQIWNTSGGAFESYSTANYTDYDVAASEQGTASGFYAGTFPSTITAGVYSIVAKLRVGGTPAETDPVIGVGDIQWNGSATAPLADAATSGQIGQYLPMRVFRGQQLLNFGFKMVSSSDHVTPFTSGVVSGQIGRDGGSWGALQSGSFTELGNGWYNLSALTSGDLNANVARLMFTGVGISGGAADQRDFFFVLQRTSGQAVT